jgi:hypothetical protein
MDPLFACKWARKLDGHPCSPLAVERLGRLDSSYDHGEYEKDYEESASWKARGEHGDIEAISGSEDS